MTQKAIVIIDLDEKVFTGKPKVTIEPAIFHKKTDEPMIISMVLKHNDTLTSLGSLQITSAPVIKESTPKILWNK